MRHPAIEPGRLLTTLLLVLTRVLSSFGHRRPPFRLLHLLERPPRSSTSSSRNFSGPLISLSGARDMERPDETRSVRMRHEAFNQIDAGVGVTERRDAPWEGRGCPATRSGPSHP